MTSVSSKSSHLCVAWGRFFLATLTACASISQDITVTCPGHSVSAAHGAAPMPSHRLSMMSLVETLLGFYVFLLDFRGLSMGGGLSIWGSMSECPVSVVALSSRYLQLRDFLVPLLSGGTP